MKRERPGLSRPSSFGMLAVEGETMTEAEWLVSKDVKLMMMVAGARCSGRRFRLFAVGCCVRLWAFLDAPVREAVVTAEGYADGLVDDDQLAAAHAAATRLHDSRRLSLASPDVWTSDRELAGPAVAIYTTSCDRGLMLLVSECMWRLRAAIAAFEASSASTRHQGSRREALMQKAGQAVAPDEVEGHASLLRDIFGNPFRPVTFSPSWRTDTAVTLARTMYDSREFSAMPILADALQDAGCDNTDILEHCRSETVHVRGCWVVDLVLGKE
jgi:hypothetical protein